MHLYYVRLFCAFVFVYKLVRIGYSVFVTLLILVWHNALPVVIWLLTMLFSLLVLANYILELVKTKFNISACVPSDEVTSKSTVIKQIKELAFDGITEVSELTVQFYPPAYIQRYLAVSDVINLYGKTGSIKKVVDFGCSELGFFKYVKQLQGVEEYLGVDIDSRVLEEKYLRVLPLHSDFLIKRSAPLNVLILKGSVVEADVRLKDTDVVVAIELIEHMYPDELNRLPYNIFGVIQPEIAIFTTPNIEFNVLFPNKDSFRHADHKFEWNRKQFEDWANNIVIQYPYYYVIFHGIGLGPTDFHHLGCCSQMAVFVKNGDGPNIYDEVYSDIYEFIHRGNYPFQTPEEKLKYQLDYEFYNFVKRVSETEEYVIGDRREIPVDIILKEIRVDCSREYLLEFLNNASNDIEYINGKATLVLPYFEPGDYSHSSNSSEFNDDDVGLENNKEDNENAGERHEEKYWDLGFSDDGIDKMKSGELEGPEESESAVAVVEGEENSSCLLKSSYCDMKCASSCVKNSLDLHTEYDQVASSSFGGISEKVVPQSVDKCKSTGAIPKQRSLYKKYTHSSISVSSDDTERCVPLTRSVGFVNIHEDTSQFSSFFSDDLRENGSEESLSNRCKKCSQVYFDSHICLGTSIEENKDNNHEPSGQNDVELTSPSSVHRSHSLGNVKITNGKSKNFRYSLNIDNKELDCDTSVIDMDLEVCCKVSSVPSLTEGSQSKAVDSGYPNSVHDMELDLTPEQVDEIITETESSLEDEDSSADERIEQQVPGNAPIVFLDNVENGDVANNNRDGEGNNMEGGVAIEGEVLGFEGLVLEVGDVEAAGHNESEDEGLYLSAIDEANETVIPGEISLMDETLFNSVIEGPSFLCSGITETHETESQASFEESCVYFPLWLLNISIDDNHSEGDNEGTSCDQVPMLQIIDIENESDSAVFVENIEVEADVELTVEGDTLGGGEPA